MILILCDEFIQAAKTYIDASRGLRRFGIRKAKSCLPTTTLALKATGYSQQEITEMAEHLREDLGVYPEKVFAQLAGRELDHRPWMRWGPAKPN